MNFKLQLSLFLRSFFLQTGWNYQKNQNIGLMFVMWPFLKQLYKQDPDALPSVLTRYLQNFNTHPVMASFCFGALARQEEDVLKTKNAKELEEQITLWAEIKRSLSITTASIGDRLFWGTLKPLSLLVALFVLLVLGINFFEIQLPATTSSWYIFFAGAVAFITFNAIAFFIRWKGLSISYFNEDHRCFGLTEFDWNKTIYNAKKLGLFFTVCMIGIGVFYFMQTSLAQNVQFITRAILVLFFISISFITRRLRIPNMYLYLVAIAVFNIVCYF